MKQRHLAGDPLVVAASRSGYAAEVGQKATRASTDHMRAATSGSSSALRQNRDHIFEFITHGNGDVRFALHIGSK